MLMTRDIAPLGLNHPMKQLSLARLPEFGLMGAHDCFALWRSVAVAAIIP